MGVLLVRKERTSFHIFSSRNMQSETILLSPIMPVLHLGAIRSSLSLHGLIDDLVIVNLHPMSPQQLLILSESPSEVNLCKFSPSSSWLSGSTGDAFHTCFDAV